MKVSWQKAEQDFRSLLRGEAVRKWLFGREEVLVSWQMLTTCGLIYLQMPDEGGDVKLPSSVCSEDSSSSSSSRVTEGVLRAVQGVPMQVPVAQAGQIIFGVRVFPDKRKMERMVWSLDVGSNTLTTAKMVHLPNDEEEIQFAVFNGAYWIYQELRVSSNLKKVDVRTSSVVVPDCSFCKLRDEPCTCPPLMWERAARRTFGQKFPYEDNFQTFIRKHFRENVGRMTVHTRGVDGKLRLHIKALCADRDPDTIVRFISAMNKALTLRGNPAVQARELVSDREDRSRTLERTGKPDRYMGTGSIRLEPEPDVLPSQTGQQEPSETRRRVYRPACCGQCGANFSRVASLKRHINSVHLRERKWTCAYCSASFTQRSHLQVHVRGKHETDGKIRCELCNSQFTWRANYLRHMSTLHFDRELQGRQKT